MRLMLMGSGQATCVLNDIVLTECRASILDQPGVNPEERLACLCEPATEAHAYYTGNPPKHPGETSQEAYNRISREAGVKCATVALPPDGVYCKFVKNRGKTAKSQALEVEKAVERRKDELATFVADAVSSKVLREGRTLTPELRDFVLATVMRELREGIDDAPLGDLYLTTNPPPNITVGRAEESTPEATSSALYSAMAKIEEDDAFFSDDDMENSDEESAGVDDDAGPGINYDALSEDVQLLPCEIFERIKRIAQVGPISDEGREYVVELCVRALTQGVVERLLYSYDRHGFVRRKRVVPRNEGRVKIIKGMRRKGFYPRHVRRDGRVVRLRMTSKREGKKLAASAISWLDPERRLDAEYDEQSLMAEGEDVLFVDKSARGTLRSNNEKEMGCNSEEENLEQEVLDLVADVPTKPCTCGKKKLRKRVFNKVFVPDSDEEEEQENGLEQGRRVSSLARDAMMSDVESDSEMSNEQLSRAVNYVLRAMDELGLGIDAPQELPAMIIGKAEELQERDLKDQNAWDEMKEDSKKRVYELREMRRQEKKGGQLPQRMFEARERDQAADERVRRGRLLKRDYIETESQVDWDRKARIGRYKPPHVAVRCEGAPMSKTVTQMADAVDDLMHDIPDPLLQEAEQPEMTREEFLSLESGEAFHKPGVKFQIPSIATEGMEEVDAVRRDGERARAKKSKRLDAQLEHPDPDAPMDVQEAAFARNREEMQKKELERLEKRTKAELRKSERESLVDFMIQQATDGMSEEDYHEFRAKKYPEFRLLVLKLQNQQGSTNQSLICFYSQRLMLFVIFVVI